MGKLFHVYCLYSRCAITASIQVSVQSALKGKDGFTGECLHI